MMKRALISVYDKQGILDFAKFLINNKIEIISTGGTYKYLKENNIKVKEISQVTGFPEMLDGRVKTLHPKIHGGILAIRKDKTHINQINSHGIKTIDFVIVNLYPFFEKVKSNLSDQQKIEFIDIGGPSMLRSAAKNHQDVVVICDTKDYEVVKAEINTSNDVGLQTRRALAAKVFNLTSAYDAAISNFLNKEEYPTYWTVPYAKKQSVRYGENPHQSGCFYESKMTEGSMNTFEILNGKELSYNNLKDVDIAWKAVCEFNKNQPVCCALKHNTPCGFAMGKNDYDAYMKAYKCDPTSIFGGIVAFNQEVSIKTAKEMSKIFLEVIAAPSYDHKALGILKQKKNLRIIKFKTKPKNRFAIVSVDGGLLVQSEDNQLYDKLNVVTRKRPTKQQMEDMLFAMKVVKYVKSNAIVVANKGVALGIGGGQVNRIWPTIDALKRGKGATVLASDAFFPFNDVVKEAAKYNIKAIIQPGGSLRDTESIDECNKQKIAMVFTGIRHFKH